MIPTIFVQIASYRDPQLVPTLRDLVAMAECPERLKICIAWQHGDNESLEEFEEDSRCKVIDIPFHESQGVCWARNLIQQAYSNEDYTLAIDSHHRFVPGWDRICIEMIQELQASGNAKPLLTSYVPPFDPENDPLGRDKNVTAMAFSRFSPEGVVHFHPVYLPENVASPIPGRFVSAHFVFTLGCFCHDVPHDPNYYFHGEEINLAVRSFTHGYDLFHPHKLICWHEYTRKGRVKQWDDDKQWHLRNNRSFQRNRRLLGMEPGEQICGKFSLGCQRTLRDYEKYAGLHFQSRAAQLSTLKNHPPSHGNINMNDRLWEESFPSSFSHIINLNRDLIKPDDDWKFLCFIYHDLSGQELFRRDISGENLSKLLQQLSTTGTFAQELNFPIFHDRDPKKWIVWPFSRTRGWLKKIEGEL